MRIAPSLALILSLAACEHASNATSPSTLPELEPSGAEEPAPAEDVAPPPSPSDAAMPAPGAAIAKPGPTAPATKPSTDAKTVTPAFGDPCYQRVTRAAPKWRPECDAPRVTKKPPADTAPASPKAGAGTP